MARTALQIETEIEELQSALHQLQTGQMLQQLVVGTGESQKRYTYNEITPEKIKQAIKDRRQELADLTVEAEPIFREYSSLSMIVTKDGI